MIGEGWLDLLDQTLDFNVTPKVEATQANSGANASLTAAVNPTEGLLNIHLSGPIAKPKVTSNMSAPKAIGNVIKNTVGGLLKMFE